MAEANRGPISIGCMYSVNWTRSIFLINDSCDEKKASQPQKIFYADVTVVSRADTSFVYTMSVNNHHVWHSAWRPKCNRVDTNLLSFAAHTKPILGYEAVDWDREWKEIFWESKLSTTSKIFEGLCCHPIFTFQSTTALEFIRWKTMVISLKLLWLSSSTEEML